MEISEILSVRYNFRELWLENSTTSALTPGGDARELGEAGLTQIAGDVKEQTGRAPGKVFSRIILHFEAASYSVCDEQENSSDISISYLCTEPSCQQQRRHLPGDLPTMQEKLFLGVNTSLSPCCGKREEIPHIFFSLCDTPETNVNQNTDYTPH